MSTWQPIETAPRDGRLALVYRPLAANSGDQPVAVKRLVKGNHFCWGDYPGLDKGSKSFYSRLRQGGAALCVLLAGLVINAEASGSGVKPSVEGNDPFFAQYVPIDERAFQNECGRATVYLFDLSLIQKRGGHCQRGLGFFPGPDDGVRLNVRLGAGNWFLRGNDGQIGSKPFNEGGGLSKVFENDQNLCNEVAWDRWGIPNGPKVLLNVIYLEDHIDVSALHHWNVFGGDFGGLGGLIGYDPQQDGGSGQNNRKERGNSRISFDDVGPKAASIDPKLADENGDFILKGLVACVIFALAYAGLKKL